MKNSTNKKKAEKYEVNQPHAGFDLIIKSEEQANSLIEHLDNLQKSHGWMLLRQVLHENIALMERAIITKRWDVTDSEYRVLEESELDEMRFKRNYLEELIDKPQKLISQYKTHMGIEIPTYDPYATEARQLHPDGQDIGAPMAGTLKT